MLRTAGAHLVFVGGVHGAGKTTLSRLLAPRLGAEHVTAGALIRAADAMPPGPPQPTGKEVADVDANQQQLLRGLAAYRGRPGTLLLDGHFCLFDPACHAVEIPAAVFAAIDPIAALLVEADPNTVARRLTTRDGIGPDAVAVARLAACERAQADTVCASLGVPLCRVRGDGVGEEAADYAAARLNAVLRRADA